MVDRFIALPVGRGDAFYLEKEGFHILVDGGQSAIRISGLLNKYALPEKLDVLVCTHNDSDHANGVQGLLENWEGKIEEVWIPGSWASQFKTMLRDPNHFWHEIYYEIRDNPECRSLGDYLETHREEHQLEPNNNVTDQSSMDGDAGEWFHSILKDGPGNETGDHDRDVFPLWASEMEGRHWPIFEHPYWPSCPQYKLFIECLNAGNRIIKIVEAALDRGCRIRVFEFVKDGNLSRGGECGKLEPLNSREIFPIAKRMSPMMYLALIKANRESLVFHSPCNDPSNSFSVLFSADSDLGFGLKSTNSPQGVVIATAPHHGSEANANAYTEVNAWATKNTIFWIRSDSRSKTRPGGTYKAQPNRFCTLCNNGGHKKEILLTAPVSSSGSMCACR